MKSRAARAEEMKAIDAKLQARRDRAELKWYRKMYCGPGVIGWLIKQLRAVRSWRRKMRYAGAAKRAGWEA